MAATADMSGQLVAFFSDPENAEYAREFFDAFETSGDGSLDIDEFMSMMDQLGFDDPDSVQELFATLDTDQSGGITFHELAGCFYAANSAPARPGKEPPNVSSVGQEGLFTDGDFPPDESVVFGSVDPTQGAPVRWARIKEAFPGVTDIFEGIEPTDVCQGGLGDCWLLAAISALAEFPGAIEHLFVTNRITEDGRYEIQLFDSRSGQWEVVVIDDFIAMKSAEDMFGPGYTFANGKVLSPCFTMPSGEEVWVPLLEKAVAKFCGTFGDLNGGQALYAWQIMTGCTDLCEFRRNEGEDTWMHVQVSYTDSRSVHSWSGVGGRLGQVDGDTFFAKLREWDDANFVMGASCNGGVEDALDTGLVTGHAYSLIHVKEVEADGDVHKMICLRNPWGNDHEWNGNFSDNWSGWSKYPELQSALGFSGGGGDGAFWMCWDDFKENWHNVCVAQKKMDTLRGTNTTKRGVAKRSKKMFAKNCGGLLAGCGGQGGCSVM